MANKYFENCKTVEELRKEYRKLLKQYHPDNQNGSEEATKAINAEYEIMFELLKNRHESSQTEEQKESKAEKSAYDEEIDKEIRNTLFKIINLEGVTIEIIGSWIWVSGNTYPVKENLKESGFNYSKSKKVWYWNTEKPEDRKKYKRGQSLDKTRNKYGSQVIKTEGTAKIA